MIRRPPRSTLFPTRRSSDLLADLVAARGERVARLLRDAALDLQLAGGERARPRPRSPTRSGRTDRKSTRLNSSHSQISYAVFCLKTKTQTSPNQCPYASSLL